MNYDEFAANLMTFT